MKLASINKIISSDFYENYFVRLVIFTSLYIIFAKIGLALSSINEILSPVWPATGLACTILFLYGLRFWPAIAVGTFLVNISSFASVFTTLAVTFGNTLEALIGSIILLFFSQKKYLSSPHTRTIAIIVASTIGAGVSATIGTLSLILSGVSAGNMFDSLWITWWTGDFLGGMVVLPFIFAYTRNVFNNYTINKGPAKSWMLFFIVIVGFFLSWLLFFKHEGALYLFFIFPYLLWCATHAGERGVVLSTVLIVIIGIASVRMGYGVFIHGTANDNLVNLQLFLGSVAVSSLMMIDLKHMASLKRPAAVLFFSWLLAGLLFLGFFLKSNQDSIRHMEGVVDSLEPIILKKTNLYFAALQSGAGLFAASEDITRDEWHAFMKSDLLVKKELKGIASLGFIFRVPINELNNFFVKKDLHEDQNSLYHTFQEANQKVLSEKSLGSEAYVITFVEPYDSSKGRVGLDIATENQRKYFADLSRDTGQPTITGRVELGDDPSKTPVMIFFYPVYNKGELPDNLDSRRERLIGWVYAPIIIKDFFDSIFSEGKLHDISYKVTDEFEGKTNIISMEKDYASLSNSREMTRKLRIGNHDFVFNFKGSQAYFSRQDAFSSRVGAVAAIISLILGTLIASLQSMKKRTLIIVAKTTKELKASEELWKFALEGAGDSVWDWDIQTGKVVFSQHFKFLIGYDAEDIADEYSEWKMRIHPEDFKKVSEDMHAHFRGQSKFITECRLRCKNGDFKWVLARGMIVSHDYLGKPRRMVGTIADISARKEIEHELERQRSKLHSIFEGSSDALMLIADGTFFDCNYRTLSLFGLYSKEEFISTRLSDFSPELQPDGSNSQQISTENIKKAFEEGANRFEWTHCKKNGKLFPAEVLLTAFFYDGKMVLQCCIRDITERKQAEAIVISQREKLVASAKMSSLGEMAGGIAHEINNPLAIIIGKTSLLKRRLENEENTFNDEKVTHSITNELTNIQTTAKRIGSIIKGLRSFSRNAENDLMEKVQVSTLIDETLELSRERFKFHTIDLIVVLDRTDLFFVNGRAAQLLQVLVNLLNNAYDAVETLSEKWVELKVSHIENICKISVTDSGHGISSEVLEKIMMPFFTTKEVGKGTGLGLSISKGIIEDHKGKLYYDSTNPNTSFVIEIPEA